MSLLVGLVTQYDLWLSVVCRHVNTLAVTGCVFAVSRVPVRTHYFARYLKVTVKIRTLESIFSVFLAGSLVWWDSP